MKKYKLLEDKTIEIKDQDDYLNNTVYVDEIIRVIESTATTNYTETIGLFGNWGSGKSSILRTVEKHFERNDSEVITECGKKDIKFYFYDAWKYSAFDFRGTFLFDIATTRKQKNDLKEKLYIQKTTSVHEFSKWRTGIIFLISIVIFFIATRFVNFDDFVTQPIDTLVTLILLIVVEVILLQISNIIFIESSETYKKEFSQNDYNNEFMSIVKRSNDIKVFIIDNLDRCAEDYSIKILDFIKGFLSKEVGEYIFIIPVDENRIIDELKTKRGYNDFEAKEFLNKVFDVSIVMQSYPTLNTFNLAKNLSEENCFGFDNLSLSLIADYYGDTPRKIIKIMNLINSKREIIESLFLKNKYEYEGNYLSVITKAVIIREKWPYLYKRIERRPSIFSELESIIPTEDDKTSEISRFLKESSTINTSLPIIFINDTFDESSYSDMDSYSVRSGEVDKLIKDSINKDTIDSLVMFALNEFKEYDFTRDGVFFREFFISLNTLYHYVVESDEYALASDLKHPILTTYDRILRTENDLFNDRFVNLLEKHFFEIISNSSSDSEINKSFQKFMMRIIEEDKHELLKTLFIDHYNSLQELNNHLGIKVFKHYAVSEHSVYDDRIEKKIDDMVGDVDGDLIEYLINNKKIKYLNRIFINNQEIFYEYEDQYIELTTLNGNQYRNMKMSTINDYFDHLSATASLLRYGNNDLTKKLYPKLKSIGLSADCYRLLSEYSGSESQEDLISNIIIILFSLFAYENYSISTNYSKAFNHIFHSSRVEQFKKFIEQFLLMTDDILLLERIYITLILATNFNDIDTVESYVRLYCREHQKVKYTFIKDILTTKNNSVTSNLSLYPSLSSNPHNIRDVVVNILIKCQVDALIPIIDLIDINEFSTNSKIREIINHSNELKKVVVRKITSYNDLENVMNNIEQTGVKREIVSKVYDLIPSFSHTEIKSIDKNFNIEMTRKVQDMLLERLETLKIPFEEEEYERISKS